MIFRLILVSLISSISYAGLFLQLSSAYNTSEDDADDTTFSSLKNQVFVGATFLKSHRMGLGWNYMTHTRELKGNSAATAADLSLTEMGPRLFLFLNNDKNFMLTANYNPFVSGDRVQSLSGVSEEVTGSSMHLAFAIQAKVSSKFYIGGSINYHAISISKQTVGTTETDVSHSYTDVYPAFEMSYRFK